MVLLLKIEYRLYSDDGTMVSSNPVGLVLENGEPHYEELKYFQSIDDKYFTGSNLGFCALK